MKTCLACLIAALVAVPAFADDAARQKLAGELLTLMRFDRNIEKSFEAARQMQMAQLRTMTLSLLDEVAARDVRQRTMDYMQEQLSWKNLKDEFIAAYAEVFTADELKALVEFYRSPTGKAYVEKVPAVMDRSAEISRRHMVEIAPKVQEIVREAAARQTSGAPLPKPAPDGAEAKPVAAP